jgi:hypothetical protein
MNIIHQGDVSIYCLKNWTNSHNAGSHKFENSWLSFDNFHNTIITFFSNKKITIKIILEILNYFFS